MQGKKILHEQNKKALKVQKLPLAGTTFALGIGLISAALIIGIISYQYSFKMMQRSYQRLYLNKAHMILKVARTDQNKPEKTILENIYRSWTLDRDKPPDEYICVVDKDSNLILHSANPETVGNYTGKNPIFSDVLSKEKNLGDLVKSQKDYVGNYISSEGIAQVAAFVPVPGKSWTLGVHRSTSILKNEIQEGFRPVIFGFFLVCGLLMPITLFLLFQAYSTAQKKQLKYSTALGESEHRYQSLVDAMPQGLYRTNLSGKITFANKAQLETFHCSLEDCQGKTAYDIYPELEARKSLADDVKVIRTGKKLNSIEKYGPSEKGDRSYIETIKSPVFNSKGEVVGIQGISWDITDKKMAEEKLQHTKAHMEALLYSVPSGIIAVDTDGKLTMMNQKAEKILGVSADKHLNKHVTKIIPDSHLMKIISKNISEIGKTYHWGEKTLIISRSPIYDDDNMIGGVSVFLDQSELESVQKQLEELKILNDEFSSLVESSYDGVLTTDHEKVVKVNSSYGRITGLSAASIEGKLISELDSQKHVCLAVVQELFRQVRRHRRSLTMQRRLNSGNIIFVTGCPVLDSHGHVSRVVMNIRDVTELKSHEDLYKGVCRDIITCTPENLSTLGEIVAESPAMRNLIDLCQRVGQVDSTILLTGETGTGKDVLSRVIHSLSRRKDKPFVSINCGAIPENLLESEFFGYEKGAFTGATREGKPGLFEQANGGIVFLDEIGELPLSLQVKLLKIIQDQKCRRLGGSKTIDLDGRIIAATNRDLKEMVKSGEFREDLFYRLYVVPINIPPLRKRREDIMPLALKFLKAYNKKYELSRSLGQEVLKLLESYEWPGNVRELQNVVERMVVSADSEMLLPRHLPDNIIQKACETPGIIFLGDEVMDLRQARDALDRQLISNALAQTNNTREAAKLLGVAHSTVVRKAQKMAAEVSGNISGYKH